jgi:hypothetical protein
MPVQFTGKLNGNQYQIWTTYGWDRDLFVEWSVRPKPGQIGNVALRALAIEAVQDGTLTYWLTVWNIDQRPVTFEALYSAVTTSQDTFDDTHTYTLAGGKTINLEWNLGVAPTLITLIAMPQKKGDTFECSTPSVQLETNGTATYYFSVTNTGASTGVFLMRVSLT